MMQSLVFATRNKHKARELAAIVDATYERAEIVGMGENDPGVVFAGAGEPLLRLDVVVDTIAMVRESRHGVPFRVHSNGLHEPRVAKALARADVDRVTVADRVAAQVPRARNSPTRNLSTSSPRHHHHTSYCHTTEQELSSGCLPAGQPGGAAGSLQGGDPQ